MRTLLLLVLLTPLAAQTGRNRTAAATDPAPLFQSTTQLVIETVTVKSKDGKPITNLTAADFAIVEDNSPQTIKFFEHQQLAEAAPTARAVSASALPRLPHTQIAPARHPGRHLLALYYDFTAMPLPDQFRALDASRRFIRTQMTDADLIAIMAFRSGSVEVFQDFTADRERLLEIIETLIVGEDENAPASADTGAAFGQNDAEFNIFFTDRQLAALQTAASMLGRLNEKKSLIYFASGLRLNGTNNQAQLVATINAAIRAGVALWPVDARGLIAQAPLGDARTGSPGGIGTYTGATANEVNSRLQRSQDTMWTLAADTGGKALLDANDLSQGIVQAQRATSSYYIIGYYTTNANPDGKFRRVKITLTNGLEAELEYRQGYYAQKVFNKFTSADKERQLEEALMLADPITELTVAMEVGYFQINSAEYFVPVTVKIPGSELALARKRGAERTVIDFVSEIKDAYGMTITNLRDKVDIKLTGATAAELAQRPIEYDTGFTLLPGAYRIKFLARDAVTGRIGTFDMPFTVPNLVREKQRIAISSVVLSTHRIDLREALYSAGKKDRQLVSPLVDNGHKLIPSVTRVFSKEKDLYIYLQAYQPQTDPPRDLRAFVTFFRDGRKAFETTPIEAAGSHRTTPLRFYFPLSELPPGEYLCQVTVLDAASKKAAFWQSPVMLAP